MLSKPLPDLRLEDIAALKTNGVAESRVIDFKSAAAGSSDRDKKEFLADVTAFANASGGDMVFGIETRDGLPSEVDGIELEDADKEILRLGDLIRSGAEPRLTYFDMVWIPISGKRGVLVLRIPRSWTAPHRVTLQGHDKFYVRNSAGKHPMNVDELRHAFTLTEALIERVRRFRMERIDLILNAEGPIALQDGPKLMFHLAPLSAFVDPPNLRFSADITTRLRPFGAGSWSHMHTLEGFAAYPGSSEEGIVRAYSLAFRNGVIEAVAALPVNEQNGVRSLSLNRVQNYVLESWGPYFDILRQHGVQPPVYAAISLIGVRGLAPVADVGLDLYGAQYRRDQLILPELEITAAMSQTRPHIVMRPVFDILANAFGLSRAGNYKADGNYAIDYTR